MTNWVLMTNGVKVVVSEGVVGFSKIVGSFQSRTWIFFPYIRLVMSTVLRQSINLSPLYTW